MKTNWVRRVSLFGPPALYNPSWWSPTGRIGRKVCKVPTRLGFVVVLSSYVCTGRYSFLGRNIDT